MQHPRHLATGLHESLITDQLNATLQLEESRLVDLSKIDEADQPHVLARHLGDALLRRLAAIKDPAARLVAANELLQAIEDPSESLIAPLQQLHSLRPSPGPGQATRFIHRPKTPLNDAALLTNAHGEPSLASELRAEIDSADSIDLLCAFVMWHGLRLIERELATAREAGIPIRVVTTTYIGGTQREALDRLVRDFGAEVKIQYDAKRTRLHAKAWLFGRDSGFDTAYVGSSNLTTSAMLEGVEWNVRLSKAATPSLMDKFRATFDAYWNSPEFEPYHPDRDRDRLDDALLEAKNIKSSGRVTISLVGLEVRPYPFQQEMLDAIEVERVLHDRHRNLVVAATGTGKTVIAALDYRNLVARSDGGQPSLLFVAHRREILEQSMRTYREVLADGDFGEPTWGANDPSVGDMCSQAFNR
ncbi:DEAD/DEAH box helicase family protein [Nocardioides renjunii]|uniref:DEAD/DEAH box helicase family protein n=1 Tax=Nocardioides renjunii TaxID=3095075 RepID=UPI002AFF7422|nr:DEAD/DEAH box helicase family protein [Nocardioides sp. S-34]WQQ21672.1 phospholipase D-like domain-containing protein [Nocardioides sp. S-34]